MSENKKMKLNLDELDVVVGGAAGEPVPGAEIYVELEPDDAALYEKTKGTTGGAKPVSHDLRTHVVA